MSSLTQSDHLRTSLVGSSLPAFLRRAHETQAAWDDIVRQCRAEQSEKLAIPKMRLATLAAQLGGWENLPAAICSVELRSQLSQLASDWDHTLRAVIEPTEVARILQRSFEQTMSSFGLFNHRWLKFVERLDLTRANKLREGYNQHYVFEKECACGSYLAASHGFEKLARVTAEMIFAEFPLLYQF